MHSVSGNSGERQTSSLISFFTILFLVLIFDQVTKWFAIEYLSSYDTIPVIENVFHLTFVQNKGIAFGFFYEHPNILLVAISVSIIALFFWGYQAARKNAKEFWCLALILGGAIGNWVDRVRVGGVIDFFDFRVWPVFNIADSAISVGVVFYLILLFKRPQ